MKAKSFLLYNFIASLIMTNAWALNPAPENNWQALRNNKKVHIIQPEFSERFGPGGIFNICLEGEELRSIHPVRVCIETEEVLIGNPNTEAGAAEIEKCKKVVTKQVVFPRYISRDVCTEYEASTESSSNKCVEWRSKTFQVPIEYKLDVVYAKGLLYGNHLFFKTYKFPTCDSL